MKKKLHILFYVSIIVVGILSCVNFIDEKHIGIAKNFVNKDIYLLHKGINFSAPWVLVSKIDTRPVRVTIESGSRSVSAKLVQFNPEHWEEFIKIEGWRYFWWSNRLSFNYGYKREYRGMVDILRGYAYSSKKYNFIYILSEYGDVE